MAGYLKYFTFLLVFSSFLSFAQTGPAGIGTGDGSIGPRNVLWLRADVGVTQSGTVSAWADQSGNGLNAVQATPGLRPTFTASNASLNGFPSMRFVPTGADHHLAVPDNNLLDNSPGMSFFIVLNPSSNGTYGILNKRTGVGANQSYRIYRNGGNLTSDISDGATSNIALSNAPNVFSSVYDQSLAGNKYSIYMNSTNTASSNVTTTLPNQASPLIIGNFNVGDTRSFDGDIAEIIIYNEALNGAERIIVENYLSQKYAISIGANDFFSSGGASYINNLMGIGTADGTNKFSQSGFSDALQIEEVNGSLNSANEFIMFAHDNTVHADGVTADITVDPGVLDSRWARSWFLQSSGSVATTLRFDFGTAGLPFSGVAADYVLLYRPNTSVDYTRVVANSYAVENGDQLVVDFSNNSLPTGYYTIGEGEQLVPGNWYSFQSGDWNDPLTWTTISNGSLRVPVTGGIPGPGDNVTILSGRTVTMDSDDNDAVNLTVNGELDIVNTTGHDYFSIIGNGVIAIAGDGSSNSNFPSGATTVFADSIVGGTVRIEGAGINLNQNRLFNNVIIDMNSAANVATLLSNFTINGDLTITQGILQINDNVTATARTIATYGDVLVEANGEINVGTANARHEFNFYGDFTNQGRAEFTNRIAANNNAEATNGIVDANFLSDYKDQTIDCFGVTNFYRIEIDKGDDQTYILDINASVAANFNLFGPVNYSFDSPQLSINNNALGLIRGTVRLNINVNVPLLNNTGNYCIFESARLWVNGGSTTKTGGAAVVPYGTLQVSDGTFDVPVSSGITTRANGNIIVEGGIVTVNQIRTSVQGPTNIGGYTQSGGTVNVTGNTISTEYYAFSLTYPGNTFNMSGGTLRVAGAPTGATTGGIFIASNPGNQSVTGGTVIMEINRNNDFKVTSLAPFWNVIMRKTSGTGTQIDLIDGASGSGGNITNITNPDLRVLNNLTIESGVTLDHNGYDIEVGSDFTVEAGAVYLFDDLKPNTLTLNGVDDSFMALYNISAGGAANEVQQFYNLTIDKPSDKTVSLASGKTGANLLGFQNNLFRVDGEAFKVLSGTLDQGVHSILANCDSVVNYGTLTVYNVANGSVNGVNDVDSNPNGNNDQLKFASNQGGPTDIVFLTSDNAVIGNLKFFMQTFVVDVTSDLTIQFLEHSNGRMYIGDNNLTVYFYNEAPGQGFQSGPSINDMIVTNGNASDGGLSLYIHGNQTYTFPFGIGLTGVDPTSKYTRATATITNYSDDGFITMRPVDRVLATTVNGGGNILSYYWRVNHEEFSSLPNVVYNFNYNQDDVDGAGNETSFVAGKVLGNLPYTRNYEDDNVPENEVVNATTNTITFNGPTDTGFTIENANYTAGLPTRFIGAPQVFYSRRTGANMPWNNGNNWSLANYNGVAAGDFPQSGDIARIYGSAIAGTNGRHWYEVGGFNVDVAEIFFEDVSALSPGPWAPRISVDPTNSITAAIIDGRGTLYLRLNNANQAQVFADIGGFADNDNSVINYRHQGSTNSTITIPSNLSVYPRLDFESSGAPGRRLRISHEAEVKLDFAIGQNAIAVIDNNVAVVGSLRQRDATDGSLEFGQSGSWTLDVADDVNMGVPAGAGTFSISTQNSVPSTLAHRLRVQGNIIQNVSGVLDLYNGTGNANNTELELNGLTNKSFVRNNGTIPDLYKIIMNKGTSKSSTFEITTDFNLNGPTNTVDKSLVLQNGLLILNNSGITVDLSTGGGNYNIPSSAGLQLTQGQASISGTDTGIILDGSLIINGGTLDMDDAVGNGNNFIEYSASGNAILEISSGTLDVGSQIRPITTANTGILKYRQTGGDVRIGTQAGPENTRGMLQIYNVGSEFTFTGGTLTIERHQTSPTISALYLDPDTHDVSNSTITIFNGNTPASQTNFGINSTIPLNNLVINGTNSPTALIKVNALAVEGDLTINTGGTLNANGIALSMYSDFVNDGTFTPANNTTSFVGSGTQNILGSGTNSFFNLTKDNTGTLELSNDIAVNGIFVHNAGTINDNGSTIDLKGNAVLEGDHTSAGGEGLKFSGATAQEIYRNTSGTSTLGFVTIANSSGVSIPSGNGYEFNIDGGLRLDRGLFSIGGAYILFGQNAFITPVNPFSVTNMIQTNSSFIDSGVGKTFTANYNAADFTFPVGRTFYTPVTFNFGTGGNTIGTTSGTITVRPADEFHPTVDDGVDTNPPTGNDYDNVLQYYWTVTASGVNGLTGAMTMKYDQSDVSITDGAFTEADYIAARILSQNNPTFNINKFTTAEVDEATNIITFNFAGINTDGISGDYFAGLDPAIPDNVAIYTVDVTGDADQDVYDNLVPGGGVPTGSVVIVPSGFTLTLNQDNTRFYSTEIQDGGILEVDNTTNHRLGDLTGIGTLRIISDGINANLPAFSGSFLSCAGGSLEYGGTGSYGILSGVTTIRNLTLIGSGQRVLANNNLTVCEDFTVNGADFSNPNNRTITINDELVLSSGSFASNSGLLLIYGTSTISGGICDLNGSSSKNFYGDLNIVGGNFITGSTGTVAIRRNILFTSGSFDGGSSFAKILVEGTNPQVINGDFTGASRFNWMIMNNNTGVSLGNNIQVRYRLDFNNGIISTGGNSVMIDQTAFTVPSIGKVNSYVNGRFSKIITAGQTLTFPIGGNNRWRYLTVQAPSAGPRTWTAEYMGVAATNEPGVTNLTPTNPAIKTIAQGEYWRVSDGSVAPSGVTARIGLSWGIESDVNASTAIRENLQVMGWNTSTSTWDNFGGTSFSSGHTQSRGDFRSSSALSFSTRIVTLGSSDILNPLPITLVSFTGQVKDGRNILTWVTESELDNDYFVLERSTDNAESFQEIARLEGKGTTNQQTVYSSIDNYPSNGKNYYRLKQVDFNGDFSYADIVVVLENKNGAYPYLDFNAYPNPTDYADINLKFFTNYPEKEAQIAIYDMQGKKVFEGSSTLFEDLSLKITQPMAQGIYLVEVRQGKLKRAHRLMIK